MNSDCVGFPFFRLRSDLPGHAKAVPPVTDIMGEFSAASKEQAAGVAQVSDAVAQMDQASQQNAALVEEMAAAAR